MGADSGAAGDDAEPVDQEESLLGGGGGGGGEESQEREQLEGGEGGEFSLSPVSPAGDSAARGGPVTSASADPYANLDGLFMSDAPQPLNAQGGRGRGLGGQHDDLLF